MSTIYETIDSLCKAKGITHGKLCDDLGYSRNTMAALKSGRSKTIKLEKAQRIAAYFGVSVDQLLSGEKEKDPTDREVREAVLDADLVEQIVNLSPEDTEKVKSFIKGLLAARE